MIQVHHVSKRYGGVTALADLSLCIGPGERVALVGTNGSGKTTLLRSILGLIRVDGVVTIHGIDVGRRPEVALKSLAYIPQIAPPIEATVREVVMALVALRGSDRRLLTEIAKELGLDLELCAYQRFRDLSGGTKQKLLAALALAAPAEILICDEPMANLDAAARAVFSRRLSERPPSHVTLICSHRSEEVEALVDRVVELDSGKVLSDSRVGSSTASRGGARGPDSGALLRVVS